MEKAIFIFLLVGCFVMLIFFIIAVIYNFAFFRVCVKIVRHRCEYMRY
jgi:hypothetical protein